MEEGDIPFVYEIEKLSFPNPWHESTFKGEIQNRHISFPYVIVHSQEKKVIGYIIFWQVKDEVQINNIAIHPDFRRKGLGEAVMRKVLELVRRENAQFVFLEVRPSNAAAFSLYKKLGFKVLGIRKDYYSRPREDALVLGLRLNQ